MPINHYFLQMWFFFVKHLFFFQILILANGAYGKRMMKVCQTCGIDYDSNVTTETLPVPIADVTKWLTSGAKYS